MRFYMQFSQHLQWNRISSMGFQPVSEFWESESFSGWFRVGKSLPPHSMSIRTWKVLNSSPLVGCSRGDTASSCWCTPWSWSRFRHAFRIWEVEGMKPINWVRLTMKETFTSDKGGRWQDTQLWTLPISKFNERHGTMGKNQGINSKWK